MKESKAELSGPGTCISSPQINRHTEEEEGGGRGEGGRGGGGDALIQSWPEPGF